MSKLYSLGWWESQRWCGLGFLDTSNIHLSKDFRVCDWTPLCSHLMGHHLMGFGKHKLTIHIIFVKYEKHDYWVSGQKIFNNMMLWLAIPTQHCVGVLGWNWQEIYYNIMYYIYICIYNILLYILLYIITYNICIILYINNPAQISQTSLQPNFRFERSLFQWWQGCFWTFWGPKQQLAWGPVSRTNHIILQEQTKLILYYLGWGGKQFELDTS